MTTVCNACVHRAARGLLQLSSANSLLDVGAVGVASSYSYKVSLAFRYVCKNLIFPSLEGGFPVLWLRVGRVQVVTAMLRTRTRTADHKSLVSRCVMVTLTGGGYWRGVPKWLKVVRVLSTFVTTADWYSSHFLSCSSRSFLAVFPAWREEEEDCMQVQHTAGRLTSEHFVFSVAWNIGLQAYGCPPAAHTVLCVMLVILTHTRVNSSVDIAHCYRSVDDVLAAAVM